MGGSSPSSAPSYSTSNRRVLHWSFSDRNVERSDDHHSAPSRTSMAWFATNVPSSAVMMR